MATRPGPFPDWDLDEIDTAAPSALETDEGWALNQQPDRQVFNWFWNLKGRWVRWLDQTTRRAGIDLIENGGIIYNHTVLPAEFTGDPPTWGGTHSTTIPAAWFVAAAVLANDRVGPIDSPATVLPNSSDVYVDLGFDGVWDFNAVGNGAGAPGVAANHVRVLLFVTNGAAQITSGTYYRNGFRYVGLGTLIRTTAGLMLSASRGLTFDAVSNRSTVIHDGIIEGGNGDIGAITPETWAAKELLAGRDTTILPGLAGGNSHWWAYTINARWTGTQWDRRVGTHDSYIFIFHRHGITILRHLFTDAAPWANTIAAATWVVVGQFGHAQGGLSQGNLSVDSNGLARAASLTTPGNYAYDSARTRTRVVPAGAFSEFAGATGNWTPSFGPNSVGAGAITPVATTITAHANLGELLPQGAIITGLWAIARTAAGSQLRVQVMRRAKTGSVVSESMQAANGWDTIENVGAANNPARTALTVDADVAIRTIDHANYLYWAAVNVPGATGVVSQFWGLEIQFTVLNNDG